MIVIDYIDGIRRALRSPLGCARYLRSYAVGSVRADRRWPEWVAVLYPPRVWWAFQAWSWTEDQDQDQ
jgi:hypothetical protein